MIRVAHVIQSADARAGGTTTALFNILAAVRMLEPEVKLDVYFQRPPEGDPAWKTIDADPETFHLAPVQVRRLFPGPLGRLVARDLAEGKYDVLHIHGLWSPDLVAAARAAWRAGVPYVWQSHGMMLRTAWNTKWLKKRAFLLAGLWTCLKRADGFIQMTRDELENSVYPGNVTPEMLHVVPLPVEMPESSPRRAELAVRGRDRFGLGADTKVVAFMGRLHPLKRVDMTIEAFALAARERPEMRLLLLGKGETDAYEAQLKDLAARLGVGDRVVFAGWVAGEEKLAGLSAASALTLNSTLESFGYVLFEAIGAGTPVIITENLSLARDFDAAGAAFIAPNSIEGLAAMISRVVDDPEARQCAERARQWARREFSPRVIGERLGAVYRAVVSTPGRVTGS